jgi:hypothetical protein
MTVQEAAPLWDDPRSVHLKRWGETFGIRLDEFHYGHIVTYEQERLGEKVSYPVVWTEVCALRALLMNVGLGQTSVVRNSVVRREFGGQTGLGIRWSDGTGT